MSGILVVGRGGQLALSLAERAAAQGVALEFAGRPELDLAEPDSVRRTIAARRPDIIVNAAAYTAVDAAEDDPEGARKVNAAGPGALGGAATAVGARLVHISTDYVFDGGGDRPWREDALPAPRSVYGRTKAEGEEAVRRLCPDHVIVRTAWVYSPFGRNFARTMLALAEGHRSLRVVGDQIGNPTSALDLADGLLALLAAWRREPRHGLGATYHLAGTGATDWAGFAREIFALSRAVGGPFAEVEPIASAEWPARAPRPANSRLDSSRFAATFGYRAPPWRESLAAMMPRLLAAAS